MKGCCKGGCFCAMVAQILVVVGGLNWGLVGVGMLLGKEWNLVNMLLGSWPMAEAIVYVLVGLAAVVQAFGCVCSKCKSANASCCSSQGEMEEKM